MYTSIASIAYTSIASLLSLPYARYLQEHRGGHLRAAELVELAVQAAHGLAFLHTANVLHGDVAARNCV